MHWTLPTLRALSRHEYDVLVRWLTESQAAAAQQLDDAAAASAYP